MGQESKNRDCPDEIGTVGNYENYILITLLLVSLKGAVPLETADGGVMLCIYFSLSVQCMLTLLL